jgi:hypothetical protein
MTRKVIFICLSRLYRMMWALYPASFRAEFCDEIMCDFADAANRAWTEGGWLSVVLLVIRDACDVACNLVVVWFRTGTPTLIGLSATCSALLFELVALQGVAPTNPLFVPLHLLWLATAGAVVLCSIAFARYHARSATG